MTGSCRFEWDGYHGVVWDNVGDKRTAPVLSSTRQVLDLLKEQYPGKKDDQYIQEATDRMDIEDEENPFSQHERVKGSIDMILRALLHIESFRRETDQDDENFEETDSREPPVDKKNASQEKKKNRKETRRKHREQQKQNALEKSRESLQKQLEREQQQEGESPIDVSCDDDDNEEEHDPLLHFFIVLNSYSLLASCLIPMSLHPSKDDKKLLIRGIQLGKGTGKDAKCWLLGKRVFDVCKSNTLKMVRKSLDRCFRTLSGEMETTQTRLEDPVRMERIHVMMKQLVESSNESSNKLQIDSTTKPLTELLGTTDFKISSGVDRQLGLELEENTQEELNKHQQFQHAVNKLRDDIAKLLKEEFPDSHLSIYGSCLSDLSLGKSSDVDLSLYIETVQTFRDAFEVGEKTVKEYQRFMKNTVYAVCRKLERRTKEFDGMQPVPHARVPVVRGSYLQAKNPYKADGSLEFDICFLNDIAVVNSLLLRDYSRVDPRSKALMIAVKRWGKQHNLCSARDNRFSSYTWMNLVVYFLQWMKIVPNLQNEQLMELCGVKRAKDDRWCRINNLDTVFAKWEDASKHWQQSVNLSETSVTELLYRFFHFYCKGFPSHLYVMSIKRGIDEMAPKTIFGRCSRCFVIEDPFETAESHSPHDLGRHASETGMLVILEHMIAAEEYIRSILDHISSCEVISQIQKWPAGTEKAQCSKSEQTREHKQGLLKKKRDARQKGKRPRKKEHDVEAEEAPLTGEGGNEASLARKADDDRNGDNGKKNSISSKNKNNNVPLTEIAVPEKKKPSSNSRSPKNAASSYGVKGKDGKYQLSNQSQEVSMSAKQARESLSRPIGGRGRLRGRGAGRSGRGGTTHNKKDTESGGSLQREKPNTPLKPIEKAGVGKGVDKAGRGRNGHKGGRGRGRGRERSGGGRNRQEDEQT